VESSSIPDKGKEISSQCLDTAQLKREHPFAIPAAYLLASVQAQPSQLAGNDSPNSVAMTPFPT